MKKALIKVGVVATGLFGAGMAMAQTAGTVDVSAISDAQATVGTVGIAVFAVYVGVKVFKWIRSAL